MREERTVQGSIFDLFSPHEIGRELAAMSAWLDGEAAVVRLVAADRCRDRPEAEPRPCGSPRPPRAMPPGRLRSPPAAPGPRSRASVPDALPAAARRAGRRSWRRTRSGPCPRRRRPAAGRRPDPCRARWRHSSPRPPPPQRAEGLRLGLQQFHLHGQLSDPLHGAIQFRLHRIALALLERGVDPADRFLTPLLEPEDLYAQLARQKLHRLVTQKPQNDLTLARHRPSLAKSQRACRQSLAWGKRGRAKLARIYHRPINSNFFSKLSVMFRSSLDTSIKPILCPRKSGPTQSFPDGH